MVSAPKTAERRKLAKAGKAIPTDSDGSGGRFPIRNKDDLAKAIKAVGRAKGDKAAVRRFIMRRAKELGLSNMIPANWTSGG